MAILMMVENLTLNFHDEGDKSHIVRRDLSKSSLFISQRHMEACRIN